MPSYDFRPFDHDHDSDSRKRQIEHRLVGEVLHVEVQVEVKKQYFPRFSLPDNILLLIELKKNIFQYF